MIVVAVATAGAVATIVLTRRRTRPSSERPSVPEDAGTASGAVADPFRSVGRDHRRLVGCLGGGAGFALLVLAAPLVLVALTARACEGDDWVFDERVVRISEVETCLQLIDGGPGYVDGCAPTGEVGILGLPSDIVDGDCLTLRQGLERDLEYVARTSCP